jgi:hypothetical protein
MILRSLLNLVFLSSKFDAVKVVLGVFIIHLCILFPHSRSFEESNFLEIKSKIIVNSKKAKKYSEIVKTFNSEDIPQELVLAVLLGCVLKFRKVLS